MEYRGNIIFSRFSSNSVEDASELLENIEEMFTRYLYQTVNNLSPKWSLSKWLKK